MSTANFALHVSHAQICIFESSLDQPFNDWSDKSFSQGFAWRPGSASFRTVLDDGRHLVSLFLNEEVPPLDENCIRAFRVPFEALEGNVEVASVSDSTPLSIPSGSYALQVEMLEPLDGQAKVNVRLTTGASDFKVLRSDPDLNVPDELDLLALPAS